MTTPFEELIADAQARELPRLTAREFALEAAEHQARVFIGMRRTGKTFCCYQEMDRLARGGIDRRRMLYLNLEDDRLGTPDASLLPAVLETFYRLHPPAREDGAFLFLDEIQAVPDWPRFARRVLDTERVRLHITGSSAKMLSSEVATEFRGRGFAVEIWPFNFAEILRHAGQPPPASMPGAAERSRLEARYREYLRAGGFPAVQGLSDSERVQTLQDYVELVVVRDIVERHGIGNVTAARAFILGLLRISGKACSVNKTYLDFRSRGIDVAKDTLHALLAHVEDAFLAFTVSRFQQSPRKRAHFPRKIYAVDPGLAAAVSHAAARDLGARLETAVYLELRRRLGRARSGAISWYRTEGGHEVDFVVGDADSGEATELVQVSADATAPETRTRELRAVDEAMAELGLNTATLVTLEESAEVSVGSGSVRVVPAWRWALGL